MQDGPATFKATVDIAVKKKNLSRKLETGGVTNVAAIQTIQKCISQWFSLVNHLAC